MAAALQRLQAAARISVKQGAGAMTYERVQNDANESDWRMPIGGQRGAQACAGD